MLVGQAVRTQLVDGFLGNLLENVRFSRVYIITCDITCMRLVYAQFMKLMLVWLLSPHGALI